MERFRIAGLGKTRLFLLFDGFATLVVVFIQAETQAGKMAERLCDELV